MRPEHYLHGGPGHGPTHGNHGFGGPHLNGHPHHHLGHGLGDTYFDRDPNDYGELQESKKIIDVSEIVSVLPTLI
jgi:hypothetical protein